MLLRFVLVIGLSSISSFSAAHTCDAALIKDSYLSAGRTSTDWRLATLISEDVYKSVKNDAGGKVEVFGIPLGADFHSFQENIRKYTNSRNESLTIDQAYNVAWTGLSTVAASAYKTCIQSILYGSNGLHAEVTNADEDAVFIQVRWFVPGQPKAANVSWTPSTVNGYPIPRKFPQGDTTIRIPRPQHGSVDIAGNYEGYTTGHIVVAAMPPPQRTHTFTFDLQARGFVPQQSSGKQQVPGCSCGNTGVLLMNASNSPIAHLNAKVGEKASFRWDNGWICQGQGIENYPANVGSINFGNDTPSNRIPDIWGTATVEYPAPGTYTATVNTSVHCVDVNCNNACSGAGSLTITVQ